MSRAIKLILLIVLLAAAARGYEYLRDKRIAEENSPDHQMDTVDLLIGRGHVQKYLDIKEKSPEFNLPALKTAMSQFRLDKGRYPRDLAELEVSQLAARNVTHDPFGQRYKIQYETGKAILTSPGKDKKPGTEDDIQLTLALQ